MATTEEQRGATIAPDFGSIENIAEAFPRWCCWRYEDRGPGKKPGKVPHGSARRLDTTTPEHWLSYSDARRIFEGGGFDGVGILITRNDAGIIAFDVDNCLNDTGEIVAEHDAVTALVAMGSYLEVSPSGCGLRGFVLGSKPEGCREKVGAVEVYDASTKGRYVTVTGGVWRGSARPIIEVDIGKFLQRFGFLDDDDEDAEGDEDDGYSDLDDGYLDGEVWPDIDDDELLRLLTCNNKRGRVTRLLKGDTVGFASASEARRALIGYALWYSRDAEQVARVVESSGLLASKTGEKRSGEPFAVWEVRRALSETDDSESFWSEQAAKKAAGAIQKAAAKGLAEKAREYLVGGFDGLVNAKGKLRGDVFAMTELLARDRRLIGAVWFDAFAMWPVKTPVFAAISGETCVETLTDWDYRRAEDWLGREWGMGLRPGDIRRVLMAWADRVTRNPVRERLEEFAARWDGVSRVGDLLTRYFGARPDDDDIAFYYNAVGRMFLVSVVARAMEPGARVDTMMVLEGAQGNRKSSGVRALGVALSHRAFLEGFALDKLDKDAKIQLRGRMLGECAELDGMSKHEANTLKNFLSTRIDSYRDPYGTATMDWPRTIVLVGTTNDSTYLRDPTGNRRYWPVTVGRVDVGAVEQDAPQLWGEAVHLYRAGARWWIDETGGDDKRLRTIQQREALKRMAPDTWLELIEGFTARLVAGMVWNPRNPNRAADPMEQWSLVDLMAAVFDDGTRTRRTIQEEIRFRTALWRAGWEHNGSQAHGRWRLTAEGRARAKELAA